MSTLLLKTRCQQNAMNLSYHVDRHDVLQLSKHWAKHCADLCIENFTETE